MHIYKVIEGTLTPEKRSKLKDNVALLEYILKDYPEQFKHTEIMFNCFFVHFTRTCTVLNAHLKGMHLTIYGWRP